MSIRGMGIDVADVRRFEQLLAARGDCFARKWFTDGEISDCRATRVPARAFAARFAVKEAVWKALGPGGWSSPLPWREICVRRSDRGRLEVVLGGHAESLATKSGITSLAVSTSVYERIAMALAVAE